MAIKISGNTVIDDSQNISVSGNATANSFVGDGSNLSNLPGGGNVTEVTASGTLADGSKVIVNTDGTVSVVGMSETTGPGAETPTSIASTGVDHTASVYDSTNQKVIIVYEDTGNGSYGTAVVGTVSGSSISFGTPVVFNSAHTDYPSITYDSSNNKVVVAYKDGGNSSYGTAKVGTVSGTSISFGSAVVFKSSYITYISPIYDSANNKVVIAYNAGTSAGGRAIVGTVSGTSISFGSDVQFNIANEAIYIASTYDSTNNKVVIAYRDIGNSNYGTAVVGTVSGTSISFGSSAVFESAQTNEIAAVYDSSNQKVVIAYQDDGNSSYGTAVVGTVSGTSISFGSPVIFTSYATDVSAVYDSFNQKVVIAYRHYDGSSNSGRAIVGTVSGTSISFGSPVTFESANSRYMSIAYDSTNQKSIICYGDGGNSYYATAAVFSTTGFTLPSVGSATVFESAFTYEPRATYDSTNNKVVIVYRDIGNSGYGTAVVGTVSGTGISFGAPVVFNSGSTLYQVAEYDTSNNKVVIAYADYGAGGSGKAIVGTVSGTSISFGSEVTFESQNVNDTGIAYDSANSKIIVAYKNADSSGHGMARVGTVSGTSISFGSEVTFSGVGSNANDFIDAIYDSANGKVVITYRDHSNSYKATAIVGTVSGTSISFGTATAFGGLETIDGTYYGAPGLQVKTAYDSANGKVVVSYNEIIKVGTVSGTSISFGSGVVNTSPSSNAGRGNIIYDSDAQKVIITYRDYGNSNRGSLVVGTVSGTSITLDSPIVFANTQINDATALVYDSLNKKSVIAYQDSDNSAYGTAVVFSPVTMATNLTTENYIGISDGSFTDGQTATIQLIGSVDDAQSSLTPGQKYYVQDDGTLAESGSVFAGTAVSSTSLVVKS